MTKTRSLTPERAGKGDFSPQHSLHAFGLMTRFPVWCRLGSGHSVSQSFCVARAPTLRHRPHARAGLAARLPLGSLARSGNRERTYDRIPLSRIVIPLSTRAPDATARPVFGVLTHGVAGARTSRVSTDLATPRRAPLTARISPYTVRVIVRSMNRYTISLCTRGYCVNR